MLHVFCTFLGLVEPSQALLLTTCHPKVVGEVSYAIVTNHTIDS